MLKRLQKFLFHVKHFLNERGEVTVQDLPPAAPEPPAAVTPPPPTSPEPPAPAAPAEPNKEALDALKPDEIKNLLDKKPAPAAPATPPADDRSKWFDPARGFRTKEDADRSYSELQEAHRQKAEKLKEFEQREALLAQEQERLRAEAAKAPLTAEDKAKQVALERWKAENADALKFIKEEIKKDLEVEEQQNAFQRAALEARKAWKDGFDQEEARKVLWPVMEQIYKEKDVFQEFAKNPLPFIEALAFQRNFATVAEKIKAEAIEQFKATQLQASEAERRNFTAIPGGLKQPAGDIDPAKMSSQEIGSLLPRNENG
jgi:hypothetical protein